MEFRLWDEEVEAAREKISLEAQEFVQWYKSGDPGTGTPHERAEAMRKAEVAMVMRSEKALDRTIEGLTGSLRLR